MILSLSLHSSTLHGLIEDVAIGYFCGAVLVVVVQTHLGGMFLSTHEFLAPVGPGTFSTLPAHSSLGKIERKMPPRWD